jgi:putative nucleotidyltransferase with HDIG domain
MRVVECEKTEVVSGLPTDLGSEWEGLLVRSFGSQFTLIDGETGEVISLSPEQPKGEGWNWSELCRTVSQSLHAEFLGEDDPFIVLALPIADAEGRAVVAVGVFLTRAVRPEEDLSAAAERLGLQAEEASFWAASQTPWTAEVLLSMGCLVLDQVRSRRQIMKLERETNSLSAHLASTYEEISLLHRLMQHLKISQSDEELGRGTLDWLDEVIPARGFALQLIPVPDAQKTLNHSVRTAPLFLVHGTCPVRADQFSDLVDYLEMNKSGQPLVFNHPEEKRADWPLPQIQQMIVVSLVEGENLFGYLAAFNHVEGGEFGTVEGNLMSSVAAILGIQSGNIELYRQQSELLAGIVRALTSAIDAKDEYTCGHSDRVADIAVQLAQEMQCDSEMIRTIYLAGLLHDVGKIGVEDSLLRKPGILSPEEYERVKSHVEIGHHILHDLNKFEDVLPVVLHHHEAWDGGGYPQRLDCQKIPLAARIIAVADAFDAMSSDRPYRTGMAQEKIARILHEGSGKQWDPEVIAAFFRIHEDILEIAQDSSDKEDEMGQMRNSPALNS